MADRHLIGPVPGSSAKTPSGSRRRALPPDLLRDASRRLGIMSLVGCGLWTAGTVLGHLAARSMSPGDQQWLRLGGPDAVAALSVLASLLLFAYTRRGERDPMSVLDLGLAYMVFTAFALGLTFHWAPFPANHSISPAISWIGAVVLMFAAIVPSTPAKTLLAGVLAVSMNPIAMWIARARGLWNFEATTDALLMHYPDYLLLGVAVVISHVVTGLGQQVAKAREMGSYQLGELLGRGGMGEVYHATHRMLARPAAIKLIRPEMLGGSDPAAAQLAVTRFRREAETAASLRSPHTVELYDFGVTDDQTLYFVMELLEGLNLDSLVRRHGPLPPGRVVHILRQVCASLEEAHVRGLVHRDIKPANIHVGRLGLVYDFVKVLDFGLVKPATDRPNRGFTRDPGRPGDRNTRLYGAGERPERHGGPPSRSVFARVRRLLPPDRPAGLRRRDRDAGLRSTPSGRPDATVATGAIHGAAGPRATRSGMPGEEAGGSARERRGARPTALSGRCRTLDRRSRPAVVGCDETVFRRSGRKR